MKNYYLKSYYVKSLLIEFVIIFYKLIKVIVKFIYYISQSLRYYLYLLKYIILKTTKLK